MLTLLRIVKYGFQNTIRTIMIAQSTVWVTTFALVVISSLLIFNKLIVQVVEKLKGQVDLTISIKKTADESDVLKLKQNLESMPQITRVDFIPREKIYEEAQSSNNPIIAQSLEVLEGENPYLSELTIKTKDPTFLAQLNEFVAQNYKTVAEKINYSQNRELIDRISGFIHSLERGGFGITIVLSILVVLVTLNTVRLAIYSLREEIHIMRLVGAGNFFIRGPFFVEALFYGALATIVSALFLLIVLKIVASRYQFVVFDFDFYNEYSSNFFFYLAIQLAIGLALSTISTYLALRRYLNG